MNAMSDLSTSYLVDILKRRQIKRVVYFHADHFEPWSLGLNENTARGVDRMREMSAASSYGRKMSLFYCPFVPYNVDDGMRKESEGHRVEGDGVVFGLRTQAQKKMAFESIGPLVNSDEHEMHLHVHHEFWTRNDSNFDGVVPKWVNANSTPELDERRLDLGFKLFKQTVAEDMGAPLGRWAFVHGNWALGASDPLICKVESELAMIMRHGGFGDFSFPAGRGYCDPKLATPFSCKPIDVKRAYDDPASDPQPIGAGALGPARFFIWASKIKAGFSSLDYYTPTNRELFKNAERVVSEWLGSSVCFGGDLFVKTHAHSMKWEYEIFKADSMIPHCYPDVVALFELLRRVCDQAGVEFQLATVNEVMELIQGYDASGVTAAEPPVPVDVAQIGKSPAAAQVQVAEVASQKAPAAFDAVAQIEADLTANLAKWVHTDPMGIEGAGDFYRKLVERDHALQDYERAAFDYIVANFPADRNRVVEVGVGYGILSILLAAAGYEVVAFEGDPRRLAGMDFLVKSIAGRVPGVASRLSQVQGWFPDALEPSMLDGGRRNILLMTNVVSTATNERKDSIVATAQKFEELIIDTTRFGVRRVDSDEERLRTALSEVSTSVGSVWRQQQNEIWHFRMHVPVSKPPLDSSSQTGLEDVTEFSAEFLNFQRDWMASEGASSRPDELYASKLKRGAALEAYEVEIAKAICERFGRETEIVEIGSGYGALAILLARAGFRVHGFDGDRSRSAACVWHLKRFVEQYPHLAGQIEFTTGFFPDTLPAGFGRRNGVRIGLATNITNTYTSNNQAALLYAARDFDEFIFDLGRFGKARDAQASRDALREELARSHFEPVEMLYFGDPYEYWRFRIKPSSRVSVLLPAAAAQAAE